MIIKGFMNLRATELEVIHSNSRIIQIISQIKKKKAMKKKFKVFLIRQLCNPGQTSDIEEEQHLKYKCFKPMYFLLC